MLSSSLETDSARRLILCGVREHVKLVQKRSLKYGKVKERRQKFEV